MPMRSWIHGARLEMYVLKLLVVGSAAVRLAVYWVLCPLIWKREPSGWIEWVVSVIGVAWGPGRHSVGCCRITVLLLSLAALTVQYLLSWKCYI
jgi:hypothetical protein